MARNEGILPIPSDKDGGSPFDQIRRVDAYGREYWDGRELMPFLGYTKWANFNEAIDQARGVIAAEHGEAAAEAQIADSGKIIKNARGQSRKVATFQLSRYACYLTAMRGDSRKAEIRAALVYFAFKTREAELRALADADVQRTALARAREMVDYKVFRDMMRDNAPDYDPGSRKTSMFFATTQNALYLHLTGMTAVEIKTGRQLQTWPGREDGKPEPSPKSQVRKIAKNYLTAIELHKLDRMVGRLCLHAEDIAEDGQRLSLEQWRQLVDEELALAAAVRRPLAA